jgi:Protein of unknown function (DUF2992)
MKLTVFFNGQFWEGIVEIHDVENLKVGRYIFGTEPQAAEIVAFVRSYDIGDLLAQSKLELIASGLPKQSTNPKRVARQVSKEIAIQGISTMAQDVMRQNLEERKQASKVRSKAEKEAQAADKRSRARQKAKARHRGKA